MVNPLKRTDQRFNPWSQLWPQGLWEWTPSIKFFRACAKWILGLLYPPPPPPPKTTCERSKNTLGCCLRLYPAQHVLVCRTFTHLCIRLSLLDREAGVTALQPCDFPRQTDLAPGVRLHRARQSEERRTVCHVQKMRRSIKLLDPTFSTWPAPESKQSRD